MSYSGPFVRTKINPTEFNALLYRRLESLRNALKLSLSDWAEIMGVSRQKLSKVYDSNLRIDVRHLSALASACHLNLESLLNGEFDQETAAHHFDGDLKFVREKYKGAAYGKMRSVANYLKYAEERSGPWLRSYLMKRLQITEVALEDHSQEVNISINKDLTDILADRGYEEHDFIAIGLRSVKLNKPAVLSLLKRDGVILRPRNVVEHFMAHVPTQFESHYVYKVLSLNAARCVVRSTQNELLAQTLGSNVYGSKSICSIRIGSLASIPSYVGFMPARAKKTACIHQGDEYCQYEADYSSGIKLPLEREVPVLLN